MMSKQTTDINKDGKAGGCCCSGKDQQRDEIANQAVQSNDLPLQKLAVKGASCGGCVGKIERALLSVAGVEEAHMNLSTGVAIVSGDAVMQMLIDALEAVGFSATQAE